VGSDSYNLALSERRGRSVADFLVARRTEPARLVIEAMGESEPIASNATVEGRAANRRVELIVHPRAQ
jgi:outer membrane protein OmpA-like peptidoglycan-associated protein